jgi:hypothetical protein
LNIAPMIWVILPQANRALYYEHLARVPEAEKKLDPKNMLQRYEMVYQEVIADKGEELN